MFESRSYTWQNDPAKYVAECVEEASRIISAYWPISTFIANNGLANLEDQPFEQAFGYAQQMRGAQGYLSTNQYRRFMVEGRIAHDDLATAISGVLAGLNLPDQLELGERSVLTTWLYQLWLCGEATPQSLQADKPALWQSVARRLTEAALFELTEPAAPTQTQTLGEQTRLSNRRTVTEMVNRQLITWCAAFLDGGQAAWAMPGREQGFYQSWKGLAGFDTSLRRYTKQKPAKLIQTLPDDVYLALTVLLERLSLPASAWAAYLTRHLAQLPGWASLVRWRQEHPESPEQQSYPVNLAEYLLVRLFYEVFLLEAVATPSGVTQPTLTSLEDYDDRLVMLIVVALEALQLNPTELSEESFRTLVALASSCTTQTQQMIWQEAYEGHYRQELTAKLVSNTPKPPSSTLPAVQAVFCIDVRSEGFRRNLERLGAYETFGFAGFFGVPMLYEPWGSAATLTIAPALLTPTQVVREVPLTPAPTIEKRRAATNQWRYTWSEVIHDLRQNLLTPFAYVEMAGWLSFFPLVAKTLMPGGWKKLQKRLQARLEPTVATKPSIVDNPQEMSLAAQASAIVGMLQSIGLTDNFARLVFLCGHGSQTENNPYASALDCGACGGNHGGMSAFVAASLLNSASLRELLAEQGILIPATTFFLAGEHNTTTDEVFLMNEGQLPPSHEAELNHFKIALAEAGTANAHERLIHLPGATNNRQPDPAELQYRATDWAQVRPEWGLVRNAAFICGRRSLTTNLNLNNRVFLHSYDPAQDPEGKVLEGILTAPVVVAEWINMQYYLSTVDNAHFGSNTKLLHTVVSQVGVMQGRQSDLLVGLPQQSVMIGDQIYHEPMRLCVIIEAPRERINRIIAKHERLQHMVNNKWITLLAYDPATQSFDPS